MPKSLIEELAPLADDLRGLADEFGARAYRVFMTAVKTHPRTADSDAGTREIVYEKEIQPTPKVSSPGGGQQMLATALGISLEGRVVLTEVSFDKYTFSELSGERYDGNGVEFFYEIQQKLPKEQGAKRRRYRLFAMPEARPSKLDWRIELNAAESIRDYDGSFKEPY